MNNIKQFISSFCKVEADLENKKIETYFIDKLGELKAYNNVLNVFQNYFIEDLKNFQGHLPITEIEEDEDILEMIRSQEYDKAIPRHLFKISHYKDDKYKDVWIVYMSNEKPDVDFKSLTNAFFVIKEEGEFRIANTLLYSNYSSDGIAYAWEDMGGISELNFKYLTKDKLVKIERIQEPVDYYNGHSNYYGEF